MVVTAAPSASRRRRDDLRRMVTRSNEVVTLAAADGRDHRPGRRRVRPVGRRRGVRAGPAAADVGDRRCCRASVCWSRSAVRRYIGGGVSPATADEYLRAFHEPDHRLGWRRSSARMIAAVATLGAGAPMGLEGPSIYTGATIGSDHAATVPAASADADRRVLLVAGAAAGVAAIFKAPATGAVFALEVPYQGDLARRMLLPALVASAERATSCSSRSTAPRRCSPSRARSASTSRPRRRRRARGGRRPRAHGCSPGCSVGPSASPASRHPVLA